ncbi:MAG: alpha/beta hydrolase [Ignavibacteriaceae bacterium]
MIKTVLILFVINFFASAQNPCSLIFERDTSYNFYTASAKMHKKFPNAELVLPELPENVKEIKNIIYTKVNARELHLDIFYPAKLVNKEFPGVILIHGGGWRSGNRQLVVPMAQKLAAIGYITTAVEYRLSTEALYPAAVYDIKAAVRWMRANASKYKINSEEIAIYGCSAGGHLAALIGTTNGDKKFEGREGSSRYSSDVQAIIDVDGVVDFFGKGSEEVFKKSGKPSAAHLWFGASAKDNPEIWKEAGPINHTGKNTPPVLFINSGQPRFHAGRDEMIKKLKSFKIYSEVHTLNNTIHTFWLFDPWFEKTFDYTLNFLRKTFKGL